MPAAAPASSGKPGQAGQKRRRPAGGARASGPGAGPRKGAPMQPKTRAAQRAARQQHKMKNDPHYEKVAEAKKWWNKLREKAVDKPEKQEMLNNVLKALSGIMANVSLRHDASRVVQSIFQHGTAAQQAAAFKELDTTAHIQEMCKSKYAHQLVEKILRAGSGDMKLAVWRALQGQFSKLLQHNYGIVVLDAAAAHSAWPARHMWWLLQEVAGPEFGHTKFDIIPPKGQTVPRPPLGAAPAIVENTLRTRSFEAIVEAHPEKRAQVIKHLGLATDKLADKALLGLPIAHQIVRAYLTLASPGGRCAMIDSLTNTLVALMASRDGAVAASIILGHASAKQRKTMLKTMKDHIIELAAHDQGHMLCVKALDCVDDTVLLRKTVLEPLLGDEDALRTALTSKYGRKLFLAVLAPHDSKYFSPADRALLTKDMVPAKSTADESKPEEPELVPASLKPTGKRQAELVKAVTQRLRDALLVDTTMLAHDKAASDVILEGAWLCGWQEVADALAAALAEEAEARTTKIDADADDAGSGSDSEEAPVPTASLLEHGPSHLLYKRLLEREAAGVPEASSDASGEAPVPAAGVVLSTSLWPALAEAASVYAGKPVSQLWWLTKNRGCFILAALLKCAPVSAAVRELLTSAAGAKALRKADDSAGKRVLLKDLSGE